MLLEIGSDTNSKQAAERGAKIFAAAAREAIYGTANTNPTAGGRVNRGSMRNMVWLIIALIGGAGLFLIMNRSSLKDLGKEFAGAVGEEETDSVDEKRDNEEKSP
jgi:stage II sporulation protein P